MSAAERLRVALAAVPVEQRKEILAALDELTRPLTVRDIERALKAQGRSKTKAAALAGALRGLNIITIERIEHDRPDKPDAR